MSTSKTADTTTTTLSFLSLAYLSRVTPG